MSSPTQKIKNPTNIFAYIDGANLYKGISELGWQLDYARFRVWLKDKKVILAPDNEKCSILLKRTGAVITYLKELKTNLAIKEKAPGKDRTLQGSFS